MDQAQREQLLRIARGALEATVAAAEMGEPMAPATGDFDDTFERNMGAFVSLHRRDWGIRGCVGCMTSDRPLAELVTEMAGAAALRDPRFPPVVRDEIDGLTIEISVLTPTVPLDKLADVEIGRDGLLVEGRNRRGVLLPQVAAERGWDPETFASQTCVKANLDPDAWHDDDVKLYKFSAEVFSEPT